MTNTPYSPHDAPCAIFRSVVRKLPPEHSRGVCGGVVGELEKRWNEADFSESALSQILQVKAAGSPQSQRTAKPTAFRDF